MSTRERSPTIEIEKEIYSKLKVIAENNRKKLKPFINDLLLRYIEKGESRLQNVESLSSKVEELENRLKQNEKNMSKILLDHDELVKNIKDEIISPVNPWGSIRLQDLSTREVKDNSIEIFDDEHEEDVIVSIKNRTLHCSQHKKRYCNHMVHAINDKDFRPKIDELGVKKPRGKPTYSW